VKRIGAPILMILMVLSAASSSRADTNDVKHMFLCRSRLLAFDFWQSLQDLHQKGITLTQQLAQQVCDGMKAGTEPQCMRVDGAYLKPIASGWGGAMAMSDGATKMWFHNPDSLGWVHPQYYVRYINEK
jgi:hypothetical protein